VTETATNGPDRHTGGKETCGRKVPEIMKPDLLEADFIPESDEVLRDIVWYPRAPPLNVT
jgi:hypothetical protein